MSIIQEAVKKAEEVRDGKAYRKDVLLNGDIIFDKSPKEKSYKVSIRLKAWIIFSIILTAAIFFLFSIKQFLVVSSNSKGSEKTVNVTLKNDPIVAPAQGGQVFAESPLLGKTLEDIVSETVGPEEYTLNGVMYVEGASKAIINNQVVVEGDSLKNAKIVKIDADSVILSVRGNEVKLKML